MKRILQFITFFIFSSITLAQQQQIANLGDWRGRPAEKVLISDSALFIFDPLSSEVWTVNVFTDEVIHDTIGSIERFLGATDQGAFFLTRDTKYQDQRKHVVQFINAKGVRTIISPDSGHVENGFGVATRDFYYVTGMNNGRYVLWECDGRTLKKVASYSEPIIGAIPHENDLIYIVKRNENLVFYKYLNRATPIAYDSISVTETEIEFEKLGQRTGEIYFSFNTKSSYRPLWRSNFLTNKTELFADSVYVRRIWFENDDFYLETGWPNSFRLYKVYKGNVLNPKNLKRIDISSDLKLPDYGIRNGLTPNHFIYYSVTTGAEIAVINAADSFEIINDFAKGASHAFPTRMDNSYQLYKVNNYDEKNGSLYTFLSNGNDAYFYLYEVDNNKFRSLFKVDNANDITDLRIINGKAYWIERRNLVNYIVRRSLSDTDPPQPLEKDYSSENWYRQFNLEPLSHTWSDRGIVVKDVKMDDEGNVIVGSFPTTTVEDSLTVFYSDTNSYNVLQGGIMIVKYDKFGKILWSKSMGGVSTWKKELMAFDVDSEGNIIVFGFFYEKAYFENDSIDISSRFGTFLAKLDGSTGAIIWFKKTSESMRNSRRTHAIPKGVEFDKNDNAFVRFQTYESNFVLDGTRLWFNGKRPNSVVAKFNKNGDIQWAKTLASSYWTSLSFTYDVGLNSFLSTQRMVDYSIEEDVYTSLFITINTDGEFTDSLVYSTKQRNELRVGIRNTEGNLFAMGSFSNTAEVGDFFLKVSGERFYKAGFNFIYNRDAPPFYTYANYTIDSAFTPIDIIKDTEFIYVLGVADNYLMRGPALSELYILKLSQNGEYVGHKQIHQRSGTNEETYSYYLDINSSHLVISGLNFHADTVFGVNPLIDRGQHVSVLKIENKNWQYDGAWFKKAIIPNSFKGTDFTVYPNPSSDVIKVYFFNYEGVFDSYSIFDITGKLVDQGNVTSSPFKQIDITNLLLGTYIIRFAGGDKIQMLKFVKGLQ